MLPFHVRHWFRACNAASTAGQPVKRARARDDVCVPLVRTPIYRYSGASDGTPGYSTLAVQVAASQCIALYCIALHCIALHCIALHCIALHCIALHCIALHCIALHDVVLRYVTLRYVALRCITLHCITIHVLHGETPGYSALAVQANIIERWQCVLRRGLLSSERVTLDDKNLLSLLSKEH